MEAQPRHPPPEALEAAEAAVAARPGRCCSPSTQAAVPWQAFAKRLEGLGGSERDPPESLPYARLDLAAMLLYMADGREGLLKELQDAVLRRDMAGFIAALDHGGVGTRSDLAELRTALAQHDREGMAAVIRRLGHPSAEEQRRVHGPEHVGMEVSDPTHELLGNRRRTRVSCYITGNPVNPPSFRRPPGSTCKDAKSYAAIGLGDDCPRWEQTYQLHPYILVAANGVSDLAMEANGHYDFDGRLSGTLGGWSLV